MERVFFYLPTISWGYGSFSRLLSLQSWLQFQFTRQNDGFLNTWDLLWEQSHAIITVPSVTILRPTERKRLAPIDNPRGQLTNSKLEYPAVLGLSRNSPIDNLILPDKHVR